MIGEWLSGILTGSVMAAWATNSLEAVASGFLGPDFTPMTLLFIGVGLTGLGIWGRKKFCAMSP